MRRLHKSSQTVEEANGSGLFLSELISKKRSHKLQTGVLVVFLVVCFFSLELLVVILLAFAFRRRECRDLFSPISCESSQNSADKATCFFRG